MTDCVIDEKPVCAYIELNINGSWSLSVDSCSIELRSLGISSDFAWTQHALDTILLIVMRLKLCKGKDSAIATYSQSVCQSFELSYIGNRTKQKRIRHCKCLKVLHFLSIGDSCQKCNQIRQIKRQPLSDIPTNVIINPNNEKHMKTNDKKEILDSDKNEVLDSVPDFCESDIQLEQNDHNDMSSILKNVLPTAPDAFKTMLESQLKNISKDKRTRRWDPKVISICLSLWCRSPQAYNDLRDSQLLVLPSGRLLSYYKNVVKQTPGYNSQNLNWMRTEALNKKVPEGGWRGGLCIDEMQIQDDLQVVRCGDSWKIVGAVDVGDPCNDVEIIINKKKEVKLATHILQIVYNGFTGFRWPVAYFPSKTATAYQIHKMFWEGVEILGQYGFTIDYCSLDGASTNRSFIQMHFPDNPRNSSYTTIDQYDQTHSITFMQDCKHALKKIRNSIESSRLENLESGTRCLKYNDKYILWEHFEGAYHFNKRDGFRLNKHLTKDHIELTSSSKMRNNLALQVMDIDMLNLMKQYQASLEDKSKLDSTVTLLEKTSQLVDIFSNINQPICDMNDVRIQKLKDVLDWFNLWENNIMSDKSLSKKQKCRSLMTKECRDDLNSCILGFCRIVQNITPTGTVVIPGYINSDIIENVFCQQRGMCHGLATNPTVSQYGPGINAIILSEASISRKSNAGGKRTQPLSLSINCPLNPRKKVK